MLEGRDSMKLRLIRRIGDGTSTNIWNMNWIPRKENMRPIVSLTAQPPQLVSELLDHTNATWNTHILSRYFYLMMQLPFYRSQCAAEVWRTFGPRALKRMESLLFAPRI